MQKKEDLKKKNPNATSEEIHKARMKAVDDYLAGFKPTIKGKKVVPRGEEVDKGDEGTDIEAFPAPESVSDLEPTVKERQRIQKGTGYRLTTEEFETLEQEYKTEGFREKKEKAFSEATTREERERFFNEVAWLQRGYPEEQMRVIQLIAGGGPLSMAVEHGGDLINRMAKIFHDGGYEYAEDKIRKVHNVVTQGYGFEKESLENLEWMALPQNQ